MMQEMLRLCEAENGTKTDEVLQAGASGHTRAWRNVATNSVEDGRVHAKEAQHGTLKGKREQSREKSIRGF